jgi:predicted dinucleotide-binding enzyme
MPTSIIGVGNLGSTVARHLVHGGEPVVLAAAEGRIEGPDGELQGQMLDLDEARVAIATEGAKA